MASEATVRAELTEKLLEKIDFNNRILGFDEQGNPITDTTPDAIKDWKVRDTKLPGFGIRVYPGKSGDKAMISFFVQRKMNIRMEADGSLKNVSVKRTMDPAWPALSVKKARERGAVWLGMMADGKDPRYEKEQDLKKQAIAYEEKQAVFGKVYQDFYDNQSDGVAASTKIDRKKVINWLTGSPLWKKPLGEITHAVVKQTFDPLFKSAMGEQDAPAWGPKTPDLSTCWKAFRYAGKAYHDAIAMKTGGEFSRGTSAFGLVAGTQKWPTPPPRQGKLDAEAESGQEWLKGLVALRDHATPQVGIFADYLLCSLIWGGRRRETQLLRWEHLDFQTLTGMFIADNTKAKYGHYFPLTPWIVEILKERQKRNKEWGRDDGWVFPSRHHGKPIAEHRRALLELEKETGVYITAHDLRRTAANDVSGMTNDSLMVSIMLSHSGGRSAVTQNYITSRVKLLRPLFEARERKFRLLAGLAIPETKVGPIDALIEFLQAAQKDPLAIDHISKKADAMLVMFAN